MSLIRIANPVHGFLNVSKMVLTKAHIWLPQLDILLPRNFNILAVLGTPEGKYLYAAHNIVTQAGDVFYAEQAAKAIQGAGSVTDNFDRHAMASARTGAWTKTGATSQYGNATVIAGSSQANDAGYPKTADNDTDNTGAGADIMTHRVSYTAASFNGTIAAGLIHDSTQTVAASPLLTGYDFTPFTKAATDTLKVFVNHDVTGS